MRKKFTAPFSVLVDEIKLDIENFRYYGQLSSQQECIQAMLKDPRSRILALAKDIAENGLTPDPIVLSKDDQGDWVVREGNRRITALKILNNPQIVQQKNLRSRFAAIVRKHDGEIPETVDCIRCDDENSILEYLDRLHTGAREGTGRINWNAENKSHYDMHRGRPAENALAIKVRNWVTKEGTTLKEPYNITNLQRVLQNKGVQSKLRFSWDGKDIAASINQKTLLKILKAITQGVAGKKVKDVYVAKQQQAFVDSILEDLNINLKKEVTEPYAIDPDKPERKRLSGGGAPKKASWDRPRLIPPKNTRVSIPQHPDNVKARNIFKELARDVDVRKAPNAAAVLLRVFLELSVKRYSKSKKLKQKDNHLKSNIRSVASHMKKEGKITKEYHDEFIRICNDQSLFSARSLQRFVHSFDFSPDRQILCVLWDNIDRFVSDCWK